MSHHKHLGDILVVDDNRDNLKTVEGLLLNKGYKVRCVTSGPTAINVIDNQPPELLLLDVMMPGMSGFEVCKKIKEDKPDKEFPVIFLSALTDLEDKIKGFNVGGVDFISKPIEGAELFARVKTHMDLYRSKTLLKRQSEELEKRVVERTAELFKTNEQLQKSQKRFKQLSDLTIEGIITHQNGKIVDVNRSACDLLGYTIDELLNQDLILQIVPEHVQSAIDDYIKLKTSSPLETVLIKKNGDLLHCEVEARNFTVINETIQVLAIRDISERKQREKELALAAKEWQNTFNAASDLIFILDKNHRIQRCNLATEQFFNVDKNEVMGKQIWQVVHNQEQPFSDCPLTASKDSLKREDKEAEINGTWFLITVDPILSAGGEYEGAVQIMRNITLKKQVDEQTKKALKDKEILLYEIHHRVKNNMQIVSSLLNLQADAAEDYNIKNLLKESQGRIYAMSAIHETLHVSKDLSEIDLTSYLNRFCKTVFRTYSISEGRINLKIQTEEVKLTLDKANPLGLIINELLSNSLKYAFPGDRTGKIEVKVRLEENNEILVEVADDGVGIPDDLDWRRSNSLGFLLVRTLVETQLEGSLELDVSNGSRFNIRFKIGE